MTIQSIAKKSELVKVEFYGQELEALYDGENVWVSVKRICENLNLDSKTQREKIQTNPVFEQRWGAIPLPSAGGIQETFCLHLDALTLWLAGINPNRVGEDSRELLIKYQLECMKALNDYFRGEHHNKLSISSLADDLSGFLRVGEMFGLTGNYKILAANSAIKKRTGIDFLEELGQTHLLAEKQERLLTPTEIGKEIGCSARAVNKLLLSIGLQVDHRDCFSKLSYRLTQEGLKFGAYLDTGKVAGGTPVQQIKWYESVIPLLR